LPTRPDHFLGDLPQDIEWQAWRMLSDIAGELREEFERLTAEGKGFSEAALDILRVLERVTREVEELEAKLRRQEPIPVTPPLPAPMAAPTMTRDEARMAEFMERAREDLRRLAEQVQAGLMPTQEAIRLLFQWRSQVNSLGGPLGGLINLNTEQLSLYNALNEALQRWIDSLQETPTRLEQIREDMERALSVGRAVEEEIARATGVRFDPIAYEMEVLARTIREMYEATGEITPEMEQMLLNLSRLSREHEALTTK